MIAVVRPRFRARSSRRLRYLTGLRGQPDSRGRVAFRILRRLDRHPRRILVIVAASSAVAAGIIAGPVAAILGAVYTSIPVAVLAARRRDRVSDRATAAMLDLVALIAADLRAGADPAIVIGAAMPSMRAAGSAGAMLANRVTAAMRVAEVTGARLADLLDRLEVDVRALVRIRGIATAQATGAEATAWLLAALPVAGIALGYGVGVDPLQVLLHTRIGALCALAAIAFQIVGLVWSRRLARTILEVL